MWQNIFGRYVALRYGHQRRLQKVSFPSLFSAPASKPQHPPALPTTIGALLPIVQSEIAVRVAESRAQTPGLANIDGHCFVGTTLALDDPLCASEATVSGRSNLFLRPSSASSIRRPSLVASIDVYADL